MKNVIVNVGDYLHDVGGRERFLWKDPKSIMHKE